MASDPQPLRLGTRASALARWQTDFVIALLQSAHPHRYFESQLISTRGDRVLDTPLPLIGGKGLFTLELEQALHAGEIDFAVHSLKDLPTEDAGGLVVGAIPQRANPADALVSQAGYTIDTLPNGAVIGTSSRRRAAQLLHYRPDLRIHDIRGNVETRIRKALDPNGPYTATILACAGLERLNLMDVVTQILPFEVMLPAPGQGALAVQCRDEATSLSILDAVRDPFTAAAVAAERAFLAALEGGCSLPVAAHATRHRDRLHFWGRVSAVDGTQQIEIHAEGSLDEAADLGSRMASEALAHGADKILQGLPQHG
ncbi:MAG: hydroxymethylbilane synthase [Caldilineaceae bacterium]|nr:hydroxymethylbilane synthase [Caldilineaceae bacterium]